MKVRSIMLVLSLLTIFSCKSKSDKIVNEDYNATDSTKIEPILVSDSGESLTIISLETIEDSLRQHFDITDSLKVLATRYYGSFNSDEHARTFIDYNTNSIFHSDVKSDYGCDCLDQEIYNDVYYKNYAKYKDSINVHHDECKNLFGDWIPLRKYKEKFYLDRVICEFNRRGFTLSDSALVEYDMDGPFPNLLLSIEQNEREIIIKTANGKYKLKRLDGNKDIYVYEESYMIHNRNLHSYPIIVTDCHEVGATLKLTE